MMKGPLIQTTISNETVKPSSPTPSKLKTYNLSLLDQFAPSVHMPGVFFYPNNCGTPSPNEKAAELKKSLSQTLSQYYPFAGRLDVVDGSRVDCNDEGVEFVEARINARLTDVVHLHSFEYQPLDQFFPTGRVWGHGYEASSSLLVFQLSYFSCGGLALAVSMSHKIGDGATLLSFLVQWAAVARRNSGDQHAIVLPPHFISSPKVNGASVLQEAVAEANIGKNNCVTKKFVFPNLKIAQLKANVVVKDQTETFNPTRVELVNALLYRCAVRAAKANSGDSAKAFVLRNVVNLRNKMMHPLPKTSVGNIYWTTNIATRDESELDLNSLTGRIKKAKMQINGVTDSQITKAVEASMDLTTSNNNVEVYLFSSICGFPIYEVDFGWGKPIRAIVAGYTRKNVIYLVDTPTGDGIEAFVTLEQEDMAIFQNDDQLLKFAAAIKPRL